MLDNVRFSNTHVHILNILNLVKYTYMILIYKVKVKILVVMLEI